MDVTCERCGTEYDFDETLVSDRGTAVKCTNCGHLFKVYRPGSPDGATTRPWIVRRADGVTETLPTLRELQRRITEGLLSTEDLISRSGEAWKRLGDIAELETFFEAARAARTGAMGAAVSRSPDPRAVAPTVEMPRVTAAAIPHAMGSAAAVPGVGSGGSGAVAGGTAPGHGRRATQLGVGGLPSPPPPPATAQPSGAPLGGSSGSASPSSPPSIAAAPRGREVTGGRTLLGVPPVGPPSLGAPAVTAPVLGPEALGGVGAADTVPAPLGGVSTSAGGWTAPTALTASSPAREPTGPVGREGRAIPPTAQYPAEEVRRYAEQRRAAARTQPARPDAAGVGNAADRAVAAGPPHRELVATLPVRPGPSVPPPRLHDDEVEGPRRPAQRSAAPWVALGALLVVGGGALLAWPKLAPLVGMAESGGPAAPFWARGDEALARDDTAGYRTAISEYTKALAFDDRNPRTLTALSRAHAVWAQALAFDASDLEARADADSALRGEANRVREEQRAHVAEALRMAEDALRLAPADPDVELALADAMRLAGDLAGARAHFDRARTLERTPNAEAARVEALLAADAAHSIASARPLAEAAVVRDPALLRARLLLARAMLAGGDVSGARAHIDAILARVPGHERARSLRDAIDRGLPPAPPVVTVPTPTTLRGSDAGVVPPPAAPTSSPAATATPSVTAGGAGGAASGGVPATVAAGGSGGGAPPGRSYDWYVDRGAALLENGRVAEARQHFEAALRLQAEGSAARTGLGDIAYELGDHAGAAAQYRGPAARGYGPALLGLGRALERLNRNDEARVAYCDYLERFGSGRDANIARAGLARVGGTCGGSGGGASSATGGGGGGIAPREGGAPPPETRPNELPAPVGTTTAPPSSDSLAIGNER